MMERHYAQDFDFEAAIPALARLHQQRLHARRGVGFGRFGRKARNECTHVIAGQLELLRGLFVVRRVGLFLVLEAVDMPDQQQRLATVLFPALAGGAGDAFGGEGVFAGMHGIAQRVVGGRQVQVPVQAIADRFAVPVRLVENRQASLNWPARRSMRAWSSAYERLPGCRVASSA